MIMILTFKSSCVHRVKFDIWLLNDLKMTWQVWTRPVRWISCWRISHTEINFVERIRSKITAGVSIIWPIDFNSIQSYTNGTFIMVLRTLIRIIIKNGPVWTDVRVVKSGQPVPSLIGTASATAFTTGARGIVMVFSSAFGLRALWIWTQDYTKAISDVDIVCQTYYQLVEPWSRPSSRARVSDVKIKYKEVSKPCLSYFLVSIHCGPGFH